MSSFQKKKVNEAPPNPTVGTPQSCPNMETENHLLSETSYDVVDSSGIPDHDICTEANNHQKKSRGFFFSSSPPRSRRIKDVDVTNLAGSSPNGAVHARETLVEELAEAMQDNPAYLPSPALPRLRRTTQQLRGTSPAHAQQLPATPVDTRASREVQHLTRDVQFLHARNENEMDLLRSEVRDQLLVLHRLVQGRIKVLRNRIAALRAESVE